MSNVRADGVDMSDPTEIFEILAKLGEGSDEATHA